MNIQQQNLRELLTALKDTDQKLSKELTSLLEAKLHTSDLPDTLQPKAAEAFQLAFEAWGGVPRLLLFADRYPGAFLKLYARQTAPTIAPVLPPPKEVSVTSEDWPSWMTARRLAYQVQEPQQETPETDE